jgi:hypothetical protein
MSHPFNHLRSHHHERQRVHHIASEHEPTRTHHITHRKAGGRVGHGDEAEDKALVRHMVKPGALKSDGHKTKHRQDKVKRAKGGRTNKHKGTNVNVIVAPSGGHQNGPMPPPAAAAMPAAMPPRPPMPMAPPGGAAVPPPGLGAGPPGLGAPGLGPRRHGGRAYAHGGGVKNGPAWDGMMKAITPVQHSDGKGDGKNIGRGQPVTYAKGGGVEPANVAPLTPRRTPSGVAGLAGSGALKRKTGGPIYAPATGHMGPKLPGGSGGGQAREFKEDRARKKYASA